jgi:bifunctional UDP-N-acetylglucosamine pyrophosphorylase/glucosamine-1-phosphate N-acetyltransferase
VLAVVDEALDQARTVVVIGRGAEQVRAHVELVAPGASTAMQADQRGTGHAVRTALDAVGDIEGTLVVLNGDLPLLEASTLRALIGTHEAGGAAATVLTARVSDPTGLGRILRTADGAVERIVEERDASPTQRAVNEINAGAYVFDVAVLREALAKLSTDNDQGEEYVTDVVGLLVAAGLPVLAHPVGDPTEALGCNDRVELADLRSRLQERINTRWMREGVTILDPRTAYIDATVSLDRDAVIEPNTHLRGATHVGSGAVVGPDTSLFDVRVGEGATVLRTHAVSASIGARCQVGPYAYLRPGSVLRAGAKVGTFVETKNSELGEGAKVPHLSYIGDATIGEHSNVGAASVTVNYDGVSKHRTVIGAHARTGADNMFVAPVEVGDGAYTAAGSVITHDVPPGALGVARGHQRNIDDWVSRRRPGTAAADAAAAAQAAGAPGAAETQASVTERDKRDDGAPAARDEPGMD